MASDGSRYQELCKYAQHTALYDSIEALLNYDERTHMPPAAGEYRAEQITLLSGLLHDRRTSAEFGDLVNELAQCSLAKDAATDEGANIRWLKRQYDKSVKLPKTLVEELTRCTVRAQQCWVESRGKNDFAALQPWWEKIIQLKRQEAAALGYEESPYDALLDDYEPGELTSNVTRVLAGLREDLVPLVQAIAESGRSAPVELLQRRYRNEMQEKFGRAAAARIGFEFRRGRLDETHHPFCSTLGPQDCGITTRYDDRFFSSAFFGILHEAGHGIYEQGLRDDQFGLPIGHYASLGIHESQSRMWENLVGRSGAFWEFHYPEAQQNFPEALKDVPLDDFFFAINDVRPSLIRVEADEATYNLHILIRFELEQDLVADQLQAADLPAAWNEKYRDYLGIDPPDDRDGVMQDIHWSAGLIGYFSTYSLGNLYASQFFDQAEKEIGPLDEQFRKGHFEPLREWLREKIHQHGQRHTAAELVQKVTGAPLTHQPLMQHLKSKLGPLYGI